MENINVEVISPEDAGDDAFLYVAFYDADGRLIKACRRSEITVDNIFDAVPGAVEIKAFVWNEGLNPLT